MVSVNDENRSLYSYLTVTALVCLWSLVGVTFSGDGLVRRLIGQGVCSGGFSSRCTYCTIVSNGHNESKLSCSHRLYSTDCNIAYIKSDFRRRTFKHIFLWWRAYAPNFRHGFPYIGSTPTYMHISICISIGVLRQIYETWFSDANAS